jgi:hypothetical protein
VRSSGSPPVPKNFKPEPPPLGARAREGALLARLDYCPSYYRRTYKHL